MKNNGVRHVSIEELKAVTGGVTDVNYYGNHSIELPTPVNSMIHLFSNSLESKAVCIWS
jgi:hypothetical protein